jgi:hypothetical protein
MNKIKLPSMVEYVKLQKEKYIKTNRTNEFACRVLDYSNILPQQPNIRMFVPAVFEDGEWRMLEKPIFDFNNEYDGEKRREFAIALKEFETALDNVIFDGWYLRCPNAVTNDVLSITFTKSGGILLDRVCRDHHENIGTINSLENLSHYNLTITPKFAKELGL